MTIILVSLNKFIIIKVLEMRLYKALHIPSSMEVDIWGSCACRDSVSIIDDFAVNNYYEGISPVSIFKSKKPLFRVNPEDIKIKSRYIARCIAADYNKDVIDNLLSDHSRWIIIDFHDIDYGVVKYKINGHEHLLTGHREEIVNNCLLDKGIDFDVEPVEYRKMIPSTLTKMSKQLTQIYGDRIILLENYKANYTTNGPSTIYNDSELIKCCNTIFKSLLPKVHVVACPETIVSDPNHKWGVDPVHYVTSYYEYAASCIVNIVDGLDYLNQSLFYKLIDLLDDYYK